MIHCSTIQYKKKEDWKKHIKTKEDYERATASGIGWLVFDKLPLTWDDCLKEINEEIV